MKKYTAVVIDGKKLIRRITAAITAAVVAAICILNISLADTSFDTKEFSFAENAVLESMPAIGGANVRSVFDRAATAIKKAVSFVLTFDPFDPRTLVFGHIPLVRQVSRGYLAVLANQDMEAVFNPQNADKGEGTPEPEAPGGGQYPITAVDSGQQKALGKSKNKILIRNDTDFGINIDEMLSAPLKFNMQGDGPKILIVHTHATESYSPEGANTYSADKSDRSLDPSKNMLAVGEAVKKVFDDAGIETIHDKTLHDHPNFNGSYANSLKTVEKYKAKYPSIRVVLDLHRDAFVYENGSKAKFVTKTDGKDTAQLMIVVGTNGGGLDHPDWRENMKLALKLQSKISEKYPSLMRGVNLRQERFNGHTTLGSMIIEVGSSGNTLSEAIRGATLATQEIAEFFKQMM